MEIQVAVEVAVQVVLVLVEVFHMAAHTEAVAAVPIGQRHPLLLGMEMSALFV